MDESNLFFEIANKVRYLLIVANIILFICLYRVVKSIFRKEEKMRPREDIEYEMEISIPANETHEAELIRLVIEILLDIRDAKKEED